MKPGVETLRLLEEAFAHAPRAFGTSQNQKKLKAKLFVVILLPPNNFLWFVQAIYMEYCSVFTCFGVTSNADTVHSYHQQCDQAKNFLSQERNSTVIVKMELMNT